MNDNPYAGMRVSLKRVKPEVWNMTVMDEGLVVNQATMYCKEEEAVDRATKLASWFDANLELINIGESNE